MSTRARRPQDGTVYHTRIQFCGLVENRKIWFPTGPTESTSTTKFSNEQHTRRDLNLFRFYAKLSQTRSILRSGCFQKKFSPLLRGWRFLINATSSPNFSYAAWRSGISARHGGQDGNQKFTSTGLPACISRLKSP